jgi:hypothetical protein
MPLVPASSRSGSGGGSVSTFQRIGPIGSSQAAFTFSSIPSSVSDLWLMIQGRSDVAAQTQSVANLIFNGDAGANYLEEQLQYQGSTLAVGGATGSSAIALTVPAASATANMAAAINVWIPNIQGTSFFKNAVIYYGESWDTTIANQVIQMRTATWRSTAAITSVTITATNWLTGSYAVLYSLT